MKIFFLVLFISALFALHCRQLSAQELTQLRIVGKAEFLAGELISREHRDANGEVCAGFVVVSDLTGLTFKSWNDIVKMNQDPGRSFLFLSPSERVVEVYCFGYEPLKIYLNDIGVRLKSGEVWQVKVTGDKTFSADKKLLEVVFQLNESDVYSSYDDFSPMLSKSKTISYKLPKGEYMFRFSKEGFADETKTINITQNQQTEITLKQGTTTQKFPLPGIVKIKSEPGGAEVLINGQKIATTPYQGELVAGKHQLELRKPLYHSAVSTFTIEEGKTKSLSQQLQPRFGYLTITGTPPDANVSLDGKYIGVVPFTKKEIESAQHTVKITK